MIDSILNVRHNKIHHIDHFNIYLIKDYDFNFIQIQIHYVCIMLDVNLDVEFDIKYVYQTALLSSKIKYSLLSNETYNPEWDQLDPDFLVTLQVFDQLLICSHQLVCKHGWLDLNKLRSFSLSFQLEFSLISIHTAVYTK